MSELQYEMFNDYTGKPTNVADLDDYMKEYKYNELSLVAYRDHVDTAFKFKDFGKFPFRVKGLDLNECAMTGSVRIPTQMYRFVMRQNNVSEIVLIPKNLRHLSIVKCKRLNNLPTIPPTLEQLSIQGTNISRLDIPDNNNLNYLNVKDCPMSPILVNEMRQRFPKINIRS